MPTTDCVQIRRVKPARKDEGSVDVYSQSGDCRSAIDKIECQNKIYMKSPLGILERLVDGPYSDYTTDAFIVEPS